MKNETFIEKHAENISKLKLVLIVVCLIAIPTSFWINHSDLGSVNNRITKIESPCQRYGPQSDICREAFETAVKSITHRIACYIDRKSGKPFKPSCEGVELRIERNEAAGGGDATSTPNSGHSQPGPVQGPTGDSGSSAQPEEVSSAPPPASPPVSESANSHPITEAVGGLVEETGGTINETVQGTTCTLHLTC
ncbi:MAG TPA: hypothetical protein VFT74_13835 [Isosphaeraceae bacterium]|nr:hypothetical protein [Isosphaeraceae bacterium]